MAFDGYQEGIYRVASPTELPGGHAQLIGHALWPAERIQQLVFSPIWDAHTKPFGIDAPRASHAFCLTDRRLLVSRDYHQPDVEPTVLTMNREAVIGIELGRALLMGWAACHVQNDAAIAREAFFFPNRDAHLIAILLRTLRETWPACPRRDGPVVSRAAVLDAAGYFHERLLSSLLLSNERFLRAWQRRPLWGKTRGWLQRARRICLAHWGTLLLTDRAIYYVCGEIPFRPKERVFAHNLLVSPLARLTGAERRTDWTHGIRCEHLVMYFAGETDRPLDFMFPEEDIEAGDEWAREMRTLALEANGRR